MLADIFAVFITFVVKAVYSFHLLLTLASVLKTYKACFCLLLLEREYYMRALLFSEKKETFLLNQLTKIKGLILYINHNFFKPNVRTENIIYSYSP